MTISVRAVRRLSALDWLAAALLGAGLLLVALGVLPGPDAEATLGRIAPILVFLAAVVVLAELAARAEVFDVVAARVAIAARGHRAYLFVLLVAFATATTVVLNLDTTAVLLTPVMPALADRIDVAPLPVAMTTVWLANTASLLLPVSNLTNLLAADRLDLPVLAFAERMAAPQAAAVAATAACLWLCYWRRTTSRRYAVPPRHRPADLVLFRVAAVTCLAFAGGVLAGLPLPVVAVACAAVLVAVAARRDRAALRWSLVPWRLLVLVGGLFLVVDAITRHGLDVLLHHLVGAGTWQAAGAGALLANGINNLPAYVAVEAVIPPGGADQLLGLLVGVNVAPLVVPWASLATLLWWERCRAHGLTVPVGRFVATGALTALVATTAALAVL